MVGDFLITVSKARNVVNLNFDHGVRILVIFQHRTMFSHINGKLSPRPFEWYD